jgi:UDP-3-O-[3-hydroxymyristoyl] glucosamine N-acyltransferase
VKVPQAGIARLEDDVEIGACACVDRATHGETVVGRGSKIDNLVQIAHNVQIGPLSILCAQAGVSGSTQLGAGVVLAGQVGVVGHVRIGDRARVGAQSGVAKDVADGATVSGSPAMDHREWLKASVAMGELSSLLREVRQLRRRLEALESERGHS